MAIRWFRRVGGREIGPLSIAQMQALAQNGELTANDEVRPENGDMWYRAGQIGGLFVGSAARGAPAAPTATGRPVASSPSRAPVSPPTSPPVAAAPTAPPPFTPPPVIAPSARAASDAVPASGLPAGLAALNLQPTSRKTGGKRATMETAPETPAELGRRRQRRFFFISIAAVASVAVLGVAAFLLIGWLNTRAQGPAATETAGPPREDYSTAAVGGNAAVGAPASDATASGGTAQADTSKTAQTLWADAPRQSFEHDGVRVDVESVALERPRLIGKNGEISRPKDPMLVVRVRISNQLKERAVSYRSWSMFGPSGGVDLNDNQNRFWPPVSFRSQGRFAEGELTRTDIQPGDSVNDVLMFRPQPWDGWRWLRLSLPGDAFGDPNVVRFQIPSGMVIDEADVASERLPGGGRSRDVQTPPSTPGEATADGSNAPPAEAAPAPEKSDDEFAREMINRVNRGIRDVGGGDRRPESDREDDSTKAPSKEGAAPAENDANPPAK